MGQVAKLKADQPKDVRARAQAALEGGMSQTELARLADTSPSTLGRWIAGKYEGDNSKVERKVHAALEAIADRRTAASALPEAPAFVETPTATKILDTMRYAHIASDLVIIYGSAGVSKTEAARHYQATSPNVWLVTITQATSTVVSSLEEIADAVGLPQMTGPGGRPAANALYRAIVQKMRGTFGLLMIDEAQNLGTKALDQIRQIHDATDCGLALIGNEHVYSNLTGGNRAAYLDRLYSRVGQKLRLNSADPKDAEAIIDAWGIKASDCRKLLHKIAATPGGLRSLSKTLRLASMFSAGDGRDTNCTDIRAAWKRLGGAA